MNAEADTSRALERAFHLAGAVVVVLVAVTSFPHDDALRHVGLSFAEQRSWGEVYPFSIFETHSACDPWLGYDLFLRGLAGVSAWLPAGGLLPRFLIVKLLVAMMVASLFWLAALRSRLPSTLYRGSDLLVAMTVYALMMVWPINRAAGARPFVFGILLLLYSVSRKGFFRGLLSCALCSALYPYLAWMYMGPVAIAHAFKGCRRFAAGAALAALAGFALQPVNCWGLVIDLVRADAVRADLVPQITEFAPPWSHPFLVLFYLGLFLALWLKMPKPARALRYEHVLMLLFLPISLKYVRFFVDVQLPLLLVAHGVDALQALRPAVDHLLASAKESVTPASGNDATTAPAGRRRRPPWLRPALVVGYGAVAIAIGTRACSDLAGVQRTASALSAVPRQSLVLTEFNLQYDLLFVRPDLRIVPSSEAGFPRPDIKDPYLAFFNRGRVCALAKRIGAQYFMEMRGTYLDPLDTGCLQLVGEHERLRVWKIDEAAR